MKKVAASLENPQAFGTPMTSFLMCLLGLLFFSVWRPPAVLADYPPSVYVEMQESAPEVFRIQVQQVHTEPTTQMTAAFHPILVDVKAKVVEVLRTASGVKAGEDIPIRYISFGNPPGVVGLVGPEILEAQTAYMAYLQLDQEQNAFVIAAKGESFVSSYLTIETICEPIGRNGEQLDLCVENREGIEVFGRTDYFYLNSPAGKTESPLGGGFGTHRLMASPGRNYIVIEGNAGEGHGMFGVLDLDEVRANKEDPTYCFGLDDLSGYSALEWQGESLQFEAEVNLQEGEHFADQSGTIYRYRLTPAEDCRLELIHSK